MSSTSKHHFEKPFVLSMGPQRAGTSWLDRYLRSHGDVCLPSEVKEIFFFDRNYDRGADWYLSHFAPEAQHKIVMEVSTTSFDVPEAPKRVFDVFGENIRMICPMRHPVARAYSLYLHYKRYGMVSGSLQEACADNAQIIGSSRYAKHLKNWYEYFPQETIRILYQEDLEKDYAIYVRAACEALELPFKDVPPEVKGRYNATTRAPFPKLATLAQKGADFLRQNKMYGVINFAKAMGLKRVIFGGGGLGGRDDLKAQYAGELAWLEEQLADEVRQMEDLLGPIPQWQDGYLDDDNQAVA